MALLDPAPREVQIVNRGHMAPLLVDGQDTAYVGEAEVEAFTNYLMSIFGSREDDVAMIALRRMPLAGTP